MTVPKYKRTLSDMEFFHKALELRKAITLILLKNFNIHDKVRRFGLFERMNNISEDDRKKLEEILSKYQIIDILERYPQWFIDDCRKTITDYLRDLIRNIVCANSIYPTSVEEYHERRRYQNRAINCCFSLLQEFQFIISLIPCDIEKYMPFVGMMSEEIKLLKGWRKSDNKILRNITKKGEEKGSDLNKLCSQ
jgi:hypothetical protein